MSPQPTTTQTRTRTRRPSITITEATEAKLAKLAETTAQKARAAGIMLPAPTAAQLVEVMVDTALESENGSTG